MSFVTNIISCPWHLFTSSWKYSVTFIIAVSLVIDSQNDKGDQLEIDRSQSFCLLQSVCYN